MTAHRNDSAAEVLPSPHTDSKAVRIAARWLSPILVWEGTRTRTEPTLVISLRPCRRIDVRLWEAEVGEIVTTDTGRFPFRHMLSVVTEDGLAPIDYDEAFDILDPPGAEDRAAQRIHDAAADAEGLPRQLARFVGEHDLRDGVHRVGNSHYFAERCTRRQAFWRRASRAEVAALGGQRT